MQFILKFLLLISLLIIAGCKAQQPESGAISGKLHLFLHRQEPIGLYVRFALKEDGNNAAQPYIASTGFKKITQQPIHFLLSYPADSIDQQRRYRFFATVAEDPLGEKEISSMSLPVLTYGHPATIDMAMQPLTEPIE